VFQTEAERLAAIPDQAGREMEIEAALIRFHALGFNGAEERPRDALTPSAETKAAYMGEFSMPWPEQDEEGNEVVRSVNVPWVTIKQIMARIRQHANLA